MNQIINFFQVESSDPNVIGAMQTSREPAPSLSGQGEAVVMATGDWTGASRGARNSPHPGSCVPAGQAGF